MIKQWNVILSAVLILALCSAACIQHPGNSNAVSSGSETGTIRVSGAFALYPMMVRWGEEYHRIHPGIKVEVSAGGAGQGITDTLTGQSDLGMVSRSIYPAETEKGAVWVSVARDAVVPVVNKNNPAVSVLAKNGLNRSGFSGIFIRQNITTWGEAAGNPGVNEAIHVYTRSDSSGAAEMWAKYMGNYSQNDLKGTGVSGDPGISDAVKNDPRGIGYNNVNFAYDPATGRPVEGLMIVPLDINANGIIDPTEEVYTSRADLLQAIDTGIYPSPPARDLNLVAKGTFSGLSKDFVEWILTDGQQYVAETGYIPLSKDSLNNGLQRIR